MQRNNIQQEEILKKIATRIRELRIRKGYSSYESFAFDFELPRMQYWRMENGANITMTSLLRILEIHNMPLKDFFSDF